MKQIFSRKNRALLRELVATDFKLRYQGSALGYAWSLLRPLMLFLILYIVFAKIFNAGKGIDHYPVYLLFGIVLWNFFNEMTVQSLGSIVGRGDLIRKIAIPRWTIVFSTSISALVNLGLNLVVVALFMAANHVDIMKTALLVPFLIIEIYVLALGLSLFLATAFVKYRDITYIWEVILQALFYLTPIIYTLDRVSLSFQKLLLMNPMGQAIQDARYALVSHGTTTVGGVLGMAPLRFVPYALPFIILLIGAVYFKRESKMFAENI
jgi:ABC-2 type transport system permease protein